MIMEDPDDSKLAGDADGGAIAYELVEEGTHRSASFQKYRAVKERKDGSNTVRSPVTFEDWARGLEVEANAAAVSSLLASCPYRAAFWETPPVRPSQTHAAEMEFVLLDAPQLDRFARRGGPDESAFAEHFGACREEHVGCVFESLGRDAVLVSPKPERYQSQRQQPPKSKAATKTTVGATNPAHLLAYLRSAPSSEQRAMWKLVGGTWLETMAGRLDQQRDDPVWLSTSGMGIAYLHFRLDRRPKYYNYDPYKAAPPP
jgi:hypothetical protein